VHPPIRRDGAASRYKSLGGDLPSEDANERRWPRDTSVQEVVDLLDVEDLGQCRAHQRHGVVS
jgi:hypothetical protein